MGFSTDTSRLPITLTVDLAGDEPVPVVGTILDPLARDASLAGAPREFELRLSDDGIEYQSVLRDTLEPLMLDQAFVLDEPVEARFAQLIIHSNHGGASAPVQLGEWKVVARPGVAAAPPAVRNIADPLRGGHVVWMRPQLGDATFTEGMLSEDPANTLVNLEARTPVEWVVAFRADRAAQVTELQWVDGPSSDPATRFDRLDVSASLVSPVGPWRDLGTWQLDRAADGSVAPLTLAEQTWVRYLRFSGVGGSKTSYTFELPATVRVLERDSDAEYRSILGEWGTDRPAGPYEWLLPAAAEDADAADAGDTAELAAPLPVGERTQGRVHADEDVDWFALTVPEGQNTLEFTVSGRPTVGVSLVLTDVAGEVTPMRFAPGEAPGTVTYVATVTPGSSYRVQVVQPPSSVVFAFDTSGSMGPYLAFVLQALRAFADGVTPGREAVLITPFEEKPLLRDWSDQSYVLKEAVRAYVIGSGSSSAETALIDATTALSAREGARAILLVTDAETTSYERTPELWSVLGAVRPLIAAVHVGATATSPEGLTGRTAGDVMRDWAASAGGFYQYTRTHGEMDRAFDRLATWLRRPAGYGLIWTARYEEPPREDRKPGSIVVAAPAAGASSGPGAATARGVSTEIILDTSGSMLERIGSKRKIDIARAVLTELVTRRLPPGAPVALRVFGDGGGGGGAGVGSDPCATSLAVPLSPLDPEALSARIDRLEVLQETDTPIGAALRQVPGDLARASGTRVVVLISDGEETCGGDPAAAVRAIRAKGIDARVNIVGFGLSDKRLKKAMQGWARLGKGDYFDARDSRQLARAVAAAVSAPYRVLDADGNEVAAGTVGGAPVKVPPGTYSVVVLADPTVRFDAVEVSPGKRASLELPEAGE
jgi:Mg-chelatase subunit ChlD